jgi:hypothetical protein
MAITIWSSRVLNGELEPVAALSIADGHLDPASQTFIAPMRTLQGAASYAILARIAPRTDEWDITHLPRPSYLSDVQFLRIYQMFHSTYSGVNLNPAQYQIPPC